MRSVYGGRALLNLPGHHSTAAIVAEVENTEDWPLRLSLKGEEYESYNVQAEVKCKITDCESAVNIDFEFLSANQLENSLHKIDVMVEILQNLREGLIVEHHRVHDRLPYIAVSSRTGRYGVNGATRSSIPRPEAT